MGRVNLMGAVCYIDPRMGCGSLAGREAFGQMLRELQAVSLGALFNFSHSCSHAANSMPWVFSQMDNSP